MFVGSESMSRSHASHFRRSSLSSNPATPQVRLNKTHRSSSWCASSTDSLISIQDNNASMSVSVFSTMPTLLTDIGMLV